MATQSFSDRIGDLMAALERDPRIDLHHYPVRISPQDGDLVLEGTVKNVAARKLTLATARHIAAGFHVIDRLRVAAAEPKSDGALRDEVCKLLLDEPVFAEYGLRFARGGEAIALREPRGEVQQTLSIRVEEGTVTLEGTVGSLTHRRLAEALMWWTAGCEVVQNRLQIFPPEEDNAGELSDAIRMLWEKDPLVHAGQLTVDVRDGVVTVNGFVASQEEKRLAVLDVWCIPGVEEVVDRIEARL